MTPAEFQAKWNERLEHLRRAEGHAQTASVLEEILADLAMAPTEFKDLDYFLVREVADLLRVHWRTISRWCAQGRFPGAWQTGNGYWRIPRTGVEAFISQMA
jgi:excisionase family DNA binding protein